jgi:Asp-tRNA(Asn)/Glu-tRNA(Gln) amidotransferase A subunit family amidase
VADLTDLTAAEAARRIHAGTLSPVDLLQACLARIDAVDPRIEAWVLCDRDAALRVARQREAEAREGRLVGPLHGVPVALKDIFDAAGLLTTAGAPAFAHRRAAVDATSVARLRAAGAIILGKVTTTAFAFLDPSPTRNPWNVAHTPGGSSSGPAAAVGARMVPLALGSQTVGSVLRPAGYCGVIGFKPTHGRISAAGVLVLSWSQDHVGIFARSVEDVALGLSVMAGPDPADPLSSPSLPDDYLAAVGLPPAPRIGVLRELVDRASAPVATHLTAVVRAFRDAGAQVTDVRLPDSFVRIHEASNTTVRAESAAYHAGLWAAHAARYPPKIREAIELGRSIPALDYLAAMEVRRGFRRDMAPIAARFEALLSPTAATAAPAGLGSTGDPYFCAPWSAAGLPSFALPTAIDDAGLPLSVQLTGEAFGERRLCQAAAWCERVLAFDAAAPI